MWGDLYRFVNEGGALFVSTGGEKLIQATDWRTAEAEKLLPGLPISKLPFRREPGRLTLVADDNPIVRSFSGDPDAKPLCHTHCLTSVGRSSCQMIPEC